jgi:hypothetical protein
MDNNTSEHDTRGTDTKPGMYLVWSWRNRAWHRADFQGYTSSVTDAGRFLLSRAAIFTIDGSMPGANVVVPESLATGDTYGAQQLRENPSDTLRTWRTL